MKVKLASYIAGLEGYFQGAVFYGYREKYGICYARDYVYPTITAANVEFGTFGKAVTDTTWNAAAAGFKTDLQTYADAWNETQQAGQEAQRDLSSMNLFVKACFGAAEVSSFDLSTLTVDLFGGEIGDLLGTESPNVGNLITAAGLPSCSLTLADLDSSIESV